MPPSSPAASLVCGVWGEERPHISRPLQGAHAGIRITPAVTALSLLVLEPGRSGCPGDLPPTARRTQDGKGSRDPQAA